MMEKNNEKTIGSFDLIVKGRKVFIKGEVESNIREHLVEEYGELYWAIEYAFKNLSVIALQRFLRFFTDEELSVIEESKQFLSFSVGLCVKNGERGWFMNIEELQDRFLKNAKKNIGEGFDRAERIFIEDLRNSCRKYCSGIISLEKYPPGVIERLK